MSEKRYVARLTEDERSQLRTLVKTQRVAARKRARAQVLLKVDAGDDGPAWTDAAAAAAAEVHVNTVGAIRRRLVEGGVPAALGRPAPAANVVCAQAHRDGGAGGAGRGAERPARRAGAVDAAPGGRPVGPARGHRRDQPRDRAQGATKNDLKPHVQVGWVIPPTQDGEYVACMEDVRALYQRPPDPAAPLVCMDECPVQLVKETRCPVPAAPGRPERIDYEYERAGTANLFVFTEPQTGWRPVTATARRTKVDWALEIRALLEGALRRCGAGGAGARQPQHAHAGCALRSLPSGRRAAAGGAPGAARHPQARQLAEHRGERAERAEHPVPRSADWHAGGAAPGGPRVGAEPQRGRCARQLAFLD